MSSVPDNHNTICVGFPDEEFYQVCMTDKAKFQAKYDGKRNSPFEGLNGFCYHDNWLHNLLIASSLQGQSFQTQKPL
jgi:hypothetical protein